MASCNERQRWINALHAVEVDFKGLLRFSDLHHFSDILTEQEMELCSSRKNTDELSTEIIKCFCKKPLDRLAKIPECLRAAENHSLALELEGAHQKQTLQPEAGTSGLLEQKASFPEEVQNRDDQGTLAFVRSGGGVHEVAGSNAQSSLPASNRLDSTQGDFKLTQFYRVRLGIIRTEVKVVAIAQFLIVFF